MENYPVISINKKYCIHTEPRFLKTCNGFDKIPLTSNKSV